ncbi:MAG: hypothetical protein ABIS29_16980, partial [Vicinamibacterales bacterium]
VDARIRLTDGGGRLPQAALLVGSSLPLGNVGFRTGTGSWDPLFGVSAGYAPFGTTRLVASMGWVSKAGTFTAAAPNVFVPYRATFRNPTPEQTIRLVTIGVSYVIPLSDRVSSVFDWRTADGRLANIRFTHRLQAGASIRIGSTAIVAMGGRVWRPIPRSPESWTVYTGLTMQAAIK